MKQFKKIFSAALAVCMAAAMTVTMTACGTSADTKSTAQTSAAETPASETPAAEAPATEAAAVIDETMQHPVVTIRMKDGGVIKAELYPEAAPNTVNNFISLINSGYYNGVIFHRVINGFMIQGGSPDGTGNGGPSYSIDGEFTANGFQNDLKHERGVLSMARTNDPNSAGSQFFIVHQEASWLDGQYATFGKVIEGMDVVDRIAGAKTDANDRPLEDQVMEEVTVETFGVRYPEPVKH